MVSHLADADGFWTLSLQQGAAGTPTRMLDGFDPKATPAALVAAAGDASRAEVTERFHAASDGLCAAVDALDEAGWAALVEAPPGYVSASAMAHHALWDGWVHERDILLPLGETPVGGGRRGAGRGCATPPLAPAFALAAGPGRRGALAIDSDPADVFVVEVDGVARVRSGPAPAGVPVLAGPAVTLVEALSIRLPFPTRIDGEDAWLVAGVADVFETTAG